MSVESRHAQHSDSRDVPHGRCGSATANGDNIGSWAGPAGGGVGKGSHTATRRRHDGRGGETRADAGPPTPPAGQRHQHRRRRRATVYRGPNHHKWCCSATGREQHRRCGVVSTVHGHDVDATRQVDSQIQSDVPRVTVAARVQHGKCPPHANPHTRYAYRFYSSTYGPSELNTRTASPAGKIQRIHALPDLHATRPAPRH